MITVIVARSSQRSLPCGLKPIPIVLVTQAGSVIVYMLSEEHENHTNTEISAMRFHNVQSPESFLTKLKEDFVNFGRLHRLHWPHRHNGQIAEHVIFCFPNGTRLTDLEKQNFEEYMFPRIAPNSQAVCAWHEDKANGLGVHLHGLVSNFHKDQFYRLRIRDLRSCDTREDYLAYVNHCAREAVDHLNRVRKKEGRELIPTLVDIRMAKEEERRAREGESKTVLEFTNFTEALARQVGYWLPEGDDDELRNKVRDAMEGPSAPWRLCSEGDKYIKAAPNCEGKSKKYTFPLYCIKDRVRDLFLEKAREPHKDDVVIDLLTASIGPCLYQPDKNQRRPDGFALRDALLKLGFEARATPRTVEAKAPDGTLFRVAADKLRELVSDRTRSQIETNTIAVLRPQLFPERMKNIAEKTISPEMIDAPRAKKWQLVEDYIYASGRQIGESSEGLYQLFEPGQLHHRWICFDRVYDELQKRENEDLEKRRKVEQEAIQKKEAKLEFQHRINLLSRNFGDLSARQMYELAKQQGPHPSIVGRDLRLEAEISGIPFARQFELPPDMDLTEIQELDTKPKANNGEVMPPRISTKKRGQDGERGI